MAQVIAITNQKGGVGKTTTSVNLVACLGAAGHSTLLVDLDPQGNATTSVGLNPRALSSSVYRTLVGLDTPDPISLHSAIPNVSILPSSIDLAGAEVEFLQMENRHARLRSTLDALETDYDFIVVDCPPSLNMLSLNALSAANWALVPVQAEFMALEGLAHLMNTIERVQQDYNPELQLLGIIVTLYDGRTRLAGEVVRLLETAFGAMVFRTKIARSVRLSEAPSHGKPIIYYDQGSAGSIAYTQLCEEVLDACEKTRPRART